MKLISRPNDEGRPPLFNGHYGPVENRFIEMLCVLVLPPYAMRVLMCIVRSSWLYHRESVAIKIQQIMIVTGLPKNRVSDAIRFLDTSKICFIQKPRGLKEPYIFTINQAYESWNIKPDFIQKLEATNGLFKC
jgi:phage replication O-like protein O